MAGADNPASGNSGDTMDDQTPPSGGAAEAKVTYTVEVEAEERFIGVVEEEKNAESEGNSVEVEVESEKNVEVNVVTRAESKKRAAREAAEEEGNAGRVKPVPLEPIQEVSLLKTVGEEVLIEDSVVSQEKDINLVVQPW